LLEIITDITEGRGKPEHIPLLEELGDTIAQTALCGLGKTRPTRCSPPCAISGKEYEEHINEKKCHAGVARL